MQAFLVVTRPRFTKTRFNSLAVMLPGLDATNSPHVSALGGTPMARITAFCRFTFLSAAFLSAFLSVGLIGSAQNPQNAPGETVAPPKNAASEYAVACAGYIGDPVSEELQIVGSDREADRKEITQGDTVYLSRGRDGNVQVGAEYQVLRNIGPVRDPDNPKRLIGTLVHELGIVRVTEVRDTSATGELIVVCSGTVNLGDVVVPYEKKPIPTIRSYRPLAVVGVPTGRATGQILASNSSREQLTANDIVYINLGADNGVKSGDYLTVYRPLGSDKVTKFRDDRVGPARSNGYPSDRFRTRDNSSGTSSSKPAPKVIEQVPRNTLPRSLIGEIIILHSGPNTAVGIITRTTREAFIGDKVEVQ
jgi:hypothetical protein